MSNMSSSQKIAEAQQILQHNNLFFSGSSSSYSSYAGSHPSSILAPLRIIPEVYDAEAESSPSKSLDLPSWPQNKLPACDFGQEDSSIPQPAQKQSSMSFIYDAHGSQRVDNSFEEKDSVNDLLNDEIEVPSHFHQKPFNIWQYNFNQRQIIQTGMIFNCFMFNVYPYNFPRAQFANESVSFPQNKYLACKQFNQYFAEAAAAPNQISYNKLSFMYSTVLDGLSSEDTSTVELFNILFGNSSMDIHSLQSIRLSGERIPIEKVAEHPFMKELQGPSLKKWLQKYLYFKSYDPTATNYLCTSEAEYIPPKRTFTLKPYLLNAILKSDQTIVFTPQWYQCLRANEFYILDVKDAALMLFLYYRGTNVNIQYVYQYVEQPLFMNVLLSHMVVPYRRSMVKVKISQLLSNKEKPMFVSDVIKAFSVSLTFKQVDRIRFLAAQSLLYSNLHPDQHISALVQLKKYFAALQVREAKSYQFYLHEVFIPHFFSLKKFHLLRGVNITADHPISEVARKYYNKTLTLEDIKLIRPNTKLQQRFKEIMMLHIL